MKYAFMSFSCPLLSLAEMLSLARRLGYDGIEPRLVSGHKHGIETDTDAVRRREIRNLVAEGGIALCCLATSCRYADPVTASEQVEETRRCLDLAADVGASRIRVFGGVLPQGVSREQAIDLLAQSLLSIADEASAKGVTVCVETHDDWSHPAHLAQVMRRVNHPAIAVNWDLMHPIRQGGLQMDEAYQLIGKWVRHVHFHDGLKRLDEMVMKPIGEGEIDHRRALELLRAASYDDTLSGEWIGWEPYEVHLPRDLATMKRYEREIG